MRQQCIHGCADGSRPVNSRSSYDKNDPQTFHRESRGWSPRPAGAWPRRLKSSRKNVMSSSPQRGRVPPRIRPECVSLEREMPSGRPWAAHSNEGTFGEIPVLLHELMGEAIERQPELKRGDEEHRSGPMLRRKNRRVRKREARWASLSHFKFEVFSFTPRLRLRLCRLPSSLQASWQQASWRRFLGAAAFLAAGFLAARFRGCRLLGRLAFAWALPLRQEPLQQEPPQRRCFLSGREPPQQQVLPQQQAFPPAAGASSDFLPSLLARRCFSLEPLQPQGPQQPVLQPVRPPFAASTATERRGRRRWSWPGAR